MSKENVVLFSRAITKDPVLNKRVSEAETTTDTWVQIAREAGFDFTAEEFADVVGETLGRQVTTKNAVHEYLGAQYKVGDVELNDKALDAARGGTLIRGTAGTWGSIGSRLYTTNM